MGRYTIMILTQNSEVKEIFSTGVFLQAVECVINSKKQWRWVAVSFEDESFLNGRTINAIEYADKQINLIKFFQTE
jgi:hypothetical protein